MATSNRQKFESDLRIATENSKKFSHYDMDRTFNAIYKSNYSSKSIGFELFERKSPFPKEFVPYYNGTLEYYKDESSHKTNLTVKGNVNNKASEKLKLVVIDSLYVPILSAVIMAMPFLFFIIELAKKDGKTPKKLKLGKYVLKEANYEKDF